MKLHLATLLFIIGFTHSSYAQQRTDGVYLTNVENRCVTKKVKQLNRETLICISEKSVISVDDFKWVSGVNKDTKTNTSVFAITLSEQGQKKLLAISKIYSGKKLAFVVQNKVVCLMKINGVIESGKIIVSEDIQYSSLKQIRRRINNSIESF